MCRLTAYIGPEIALENIIVRPEHSLLCQSQNATEAKTTFNGDGFGIAWYGDAEAPGIYRDVLPAWADDNLLNICRMVKAKTFLAHVRASTYGSTSRENCHPFSHGPWSFVHNGQIGGFAKMRRELEAELRDTLFNARKGTTDSELFFMLALHFGLDSNPKAACELALNRINQSRARHSITSPMRMTCLFSDGKTLFAFRSSSDNKSPTLYHSSKLDHGGAALASEPLDGQEANWTAIPENRFVELENTGCRSAAVFAFQEPKAA